MSQPQEIRIKTVCEDKNRKFFVSKPGPGVLTVRYCSREETWEDEEGVWVGHLRVLVPQTLVDIVLPNNSHMQVIVLF